MTQIVMYFGITVIVLFAFAYFIRRTKKIQHSLIFSDDGFFILETTYYLDISISYRQYGTDEDNTLAFLDFEAAKKAMKRLEKGKPKFKI